MQIPTFLYLLHADWSIQIWCCSILVALWLYLVALIHYIDVTAAIYFIFYLLMHLHYVFTIYLKLFHQIGYTTVNGAEHIWKKKQNIYIYTSLRDKKIYIIYKFLSSRASEGAHELQDH